MARLIQRSAQSAFTIVELLVVVLIIGILAILAVTQFLKSTETSRADQAINTVQQIASAQHMYTLDAGSQQAQAQAAQALCDGTQADCLITDVCNDSSVICGNTTNPQCNLVRCSFLAKRDWDAFGYNVYVLNPLNTSADAAVCGIPIPSGIVPVACAMRKSCASGATPNCATQTAYQSWGYVIDVSGAVYAVGGAPAEEGASSSH